MELCVAGSEGSANPSSKDGKRNFTEKVSALTFPRFASSSIVKDLLETL
jgi:hypothetical protein